MGTQWGHKGGSRGAVGGQGGNTVWRLCASLICRSGAKRRRMIIRIGFCVRSTHQNAHQNADQNKSECLSPKSECLSPRISTNQITNQTAN
eukprot:753930-Prorocentrum_minimum.AAC.3